MIKNTEKLEWAFKIILFILGFIIILRMVLTIIKPVSLAYDLNSTSGFYESIINKSNSSIEVTMSYSNKENKKGIFSIIFKYVTGIDIENPKTYISSQIPMLSLFDINTIAKSEDVPILVIPKDNESISNDDKLFEDEEKDFEKDDNSQDVPEKVVTPGNVAAPAKIKLTPSKPLVLIVHTHTTECYNPDNIDGGNYSTDFNKGVVKIGETLIKELESKYGIATIHDKTVHDNPVFYGAYTRSRPTIKNYLKKYPSLKVVIDLHRDGTKNKNVSTAIINGERYARVMFVIGSKNKNTSKSRAFANKINNIFNTYYPGLSRGLYFANNSVYNQDLTDKLILIELGSNKNNINEALKTVDIIAKMIALSLK